jgi:uncharacterized protein YbjT (DUF2867 family)
VAQLLEKGWPVRAIVRSRDLRSARLERLGAETLAADLFDPDQLLQAMQGAQRAYYCPPFHPHMVQSAAAFAVAAREAKLESLVGLSQWLASPSHPALSTRQHWLVDHLFSMIPGMAHTIINPGFFADYPYLSVIKYAALLGIYPMPVDGKSRNAPPSTEDIARVAAAVLINPAKHDGRVYRPTGPKLISVEEIVQILGRVLNRTVRHIELPMWMFLKAARMEGVSALELANLPYYFQDLSSGAFEYGAPTDHVLETTGQHPEDFETIARRHASLPEARQTRMNSLRLLAEFLTVPLRPGLDQSRFEPERSIPAPSMPQLAMNSQRWRLEHGSREGELA